jgi:ferritin-like metal-binding protein YciE
MNSLKELYQAKLQMIYDAEQQGLQAYPQLLREIQNDELRQAVQTHVQQTQQQVQQLEQLFQQDGGGTAQRRPCPSMTALIQEAQQMQQEIQDPATREAFLISAAQAMEHHEIADYGTARTWAEQLGRGDEARVLQQILEQEEQTDKLLSQIAERMVNRDAARRDREVPMGAQSEARGSTASERSQSTRGSAADDRPRSRG